MKTDTRKKPDEQAGETEKVLNRTEATWVANWLGKKGRDVLNGWMGVYQMSPSLIAEKFNVAIEDVLSAMRGEKR